MHNLAGVGHHGSWWMPATAMVGGCHGLARFANREYSQMVYYVRVRMAIAVVRANILLIRGSRDRQRPRHPFIPDRAALGDWQTWQDR